MIISRQKEFNEILRNLKEEEIFIIGCGKCATKLHVGGETEVLEMKKKLASEGKRIVGTTVLSTTCSISSWEEVKAQNPGLEKAKALLVMSCGSGVSVISKLTDLQVYPALDTESLGGSLQNEIIKEQCAVCGDCTIWMYGGICPYAECPKGLLNGPCGGAMDGKCEVDERPCVWDVIFERLKKLRRLEYLGTVHEPKDHSRKLRRQKI